MINLFKKDATNFENNGLGSLDQNIINPEISWTDNGAFTLEFKYPLFAKHGKKIENSSIIKANDADGSNLFFVYKITPSMGYLTVLCYQISYKLAFNSINDTNIVNKNGQDALNQLSNSTQYPHNFTFSSDILTTASSRVVRKNPIEFLLDTSLDNCFVNRWGGHIVRQNFNISVNTAYGSNKGYVIRHKKDLIGYEAEFDESTVITRVRPLGADGLMLPEIYVDSPLILNYTEPRIQQFEYSKVKVKAKADDEEGFDTIQQAYEELRRLAKLEFSKNKVDVPDFSAKVEFVNLKDTDEYKDLQTLKQIKTGDIVKVVHSEDNFEIEAQMVEYKYNPLSNSYISITLGNYSKSFTSTVSKASNLQTNLNQIAQQSQNALTSANSKNTVYSLNYKPAITNSSTEGDLLYLKNGDKIELWILEKVDGNLQWVLQVSDSTQEELKAQMNQAKVDIAEAVNSANDAVDKANQNIKDISELDVKIIDTKELTDKAQNDATKAIADAKIAYDNTIENSGKIVTANQEIDKVKGEITQKVSQTDFDKSLGRITQNESSISQNANAINTKVSQIDVENILTGKAYATKSELTQTSNSLTSTISGVQSNVDALGTNTAYAYSLDGTDRFTTVYPNLNLLAFNSGITFGRHYGWGADEVGWRGNRAIFQKVKVTPNTKYTVSSDWSKTEWLNIYGFENANDSKAVARYGNAGGTGIGLWDTNFVGGYTITNNVTFAVPNNVNYIGISYSSLLTTSIIGLKDLLDSKIKVEEGSTATPWMPSATEVTTADYPKYRGLSLKYSTNPSDYKWEIDSGYTDAKTVVQQTQISQMSQDLNGFKTTVSSTYLTTANASNTYPTKDAVSGTYLNKGDASNIYLNKTDASNTYPTKGAVADTYPTKTTVTSQINQKATDITSSVQSWTNDKLTGYSTIQQTNNSITSAVADKADKSQITQLSNDINLRVAKGDVTSQINLEAGRVLIDSKQLLLNADNVKFSGSAFIPSASIQNLSADKINTGTLNASNVNITNMNASNIKTGTLSGTNLSMDLTTGAVQFKRGYIEGSDGRIRLDLDNSYLKSLDSSNNGFEIRNGIFIMKTQVWGDNTASIIPDFLSEGGGINITGTGGVSLTSLKYKASIGIGSGGLADGTSSKLDFQGDARFWNNMTVLGSKNAIHVTRDGVRATPAYETAESYLGDIGRNYTRENSEVWVEIDLLFSDTVNTDIAYEVFLQAYDNARFWVSDFKSDKFLIKSDKPMARFAWEIKAKRRGYENDRLVLQEGMDNEQLVKAFDAGALTEGETNE